MDKRSKEITFTLVGHAHIDPVWLWDWREGYETVKGTFRSALDRLKENPQMVFAHSSPSHYYWMENHPELLAEIKEAVARGQWEPVGGWWVEPDANVPSGEALARQGLYGQRYFEKAVGRRAKVAFLPDTFGHPPTLPQLFRQAGLEYFIFMRPGKNEIDLPSNIFWWEGPDGSRVLTARVETYNSNPVYVDTSLERQLDWRPETEPEWIHLFGVGNHGGGPTKKSIESIYKLQQDPNWPTIRMGTAEGFFERAAGREHPVVAHELQHHARGCYSAYSLIKTLNRKSENALVSAERFAVLGSFYGLPYPTKALEGAWRNVLFNQFHDILAGSAIESAYEDSKAELGEAIAVSGRAQYDALQRISQRVDTRRDDRPIEEVIRRTRWTMEDWTADLGDGVPVVVFNPSSWTRKEIIDVELNDWGYQDVLVMDNENKPVIGQWTQPEAVVGGRKRVCFAVEVPPMGYRVYRLVDEPHAELPENAPMLKASTSELENQWWKLTFDPHTGALRHLHDKVLDGELLAGAGAQPVVIDDPTDTWGHGMRSQRHLAGAFGNPKVELVESGPVRATVRITTTYGNSWCKQEISIYRDSPKIDGKLTVNWNEHQKTLKLAFPMAIEGPTATFSAPYGHAVRPTAGDEEPVQQWLDVTGNAMDTRHRAHPYGVALLNDSKYGCDVNGAEMRLTVLRSPVFAHHDPAKLDPDKSYVYQDQGIQTMKWSLLPHNGAWQDAGVVEAAHDLNMPMPFIREFAHAGELPNVNSYLTVTPPQAVVVTALKQAEDGDDLVLRLYEPAGRAAKATVTLPMVNATIDVTAGPNQIKTYRISRTGTVRETNFLED